MQRKAKGASKTRAGAKKALGQRTAGRKAPAKKAVAISRSQKYVRSSPSGRIAHVAPADEVAAPRRSAFVSHSRKIDVEQRLLFISEALGSKRAAAEFLDVDPSQTTRWSNGESTPGPSQARRLIDLDHVIAHARLLWATDDLVRDWLNTPNAHLEHARPVDVIRVRGTNEVVDALRAELAGSYA
jgi:hypothetical protein